MKMEQTVCSETLAHKISDANVSPKRKNTTFRTQRKFDIKKKNNGTIRISNFKAECLKIFFLQSEVWIWVQFSLQQSSLVQPPV